MIEITPYTMQQDLESMIRTIFSLPETTRVIIKDIIIEKTQSEETRHQSITSAVKQSYHDILSDIDLTIPIKLSPSDKITPDLYASAIGRYGITRDDCLGFQFQKGNHIYRFIRKNGIRYDLKFEITVDETAPQLSPEDFAASEDPAVLQSLQTREAPDNFWFLQIQALAKLYRKDHLIADHLANININETLVLQMIQRDNQYKTNFHRHGYQEELEYQQAIPQECPHHGPNATFNTIADKLWNVSYAYDKLAIDHFPTYQPRKEIFFKIWECYART